MIPKTVEILVTNLEGIVTITGGEKGIQNLGKGPILRTAKITNRENHDPVTVTIREITTGMIKMDKDLKIIPRRIPTIAPRKITGNRNYLANNLKRNPE